MQTEISIGICIQLLIDVLKISGNYTNNFIGHAQPRNTLKAVYLKKEGLSIQQQRRQSIPKSGGDALKTMKVRRHATRNCFLNFCTYTETAFPAFWRHL